MDSSLQRHPIFGRSTPDVRAQLLSASRVLSLPPRTRVLSEGDVAMSIFALERGAVRVFHQSTGGDEVSLKLFRAPVVFGEAEALYGVPYQENVETVEDCRLIEMPTAAVREFLATAPLAAIAFVEDLSARLAIASYHQRSLAFHPITIRLANFLLDYAEWTNDPGVHEWSLALSQDDMAAAIGATRRSIGKDVTAWQKAGILARRGTAYVVLDPAALERYSDPERLRLVYRLEGADGNSRPHLERHLVSAKASTPRLR